MPLPIAAHGKPIILAVDADRQHLDLIRSELVKRYGLDYRIVPVKTPATAEAHLRRMHEAGDPLAVVLVAAGLPVGGADRPPANGSSDDGRPARLGGAPLLELAQRLHPRARRALLVKAYEMGGDRTARAVRSATALGLSDAWVHEPSHPGDEAFHRAVAEFLHDWATDEPMIPREVTVVAGTYAPEGHAVRSLLAGNRIPFVFFDSESPEGSRFLERVGLFGHGGAVVELPGGRVLVSPTGTELAEAWGVTTRPEPGRVFDLVVVGAGPGGLSAAVYGASEGLSVLVVERETIGGQAGTSPRIRNYLGFSRGVTGRQLAEQGYQQALLFGAEFLQTRAVRRLDPAPAPEPGAAAGPRAGGFALTLDGRGSIRARAVVLAMGVQYRRLGAPGLEPFEGTSVFYGAFVSEGPLVAGGRVFVVGAGNSAGQAAVHLCRFARKVTLLVRGDDLGASMSQYLIDEIRATDTIDVLVRTEVAGATGAGRLEALTLRDNRTGATTSVEADAMFVLIGAEPNTSWLPSAIERDGHGFLVTGRVDPSRPWPLTRPPYAFETSLPGVFAVGDVRAGSVKRCASAVGEGSVVISQVHAFLADQRP